MSKPPSNSVIHFAAADAATSAAGSSDRLANPRVTAAEQEQKQQQQQSSTTNSSGKQQHPQRPPPREERPINEYFRRKDEEEHDVNRPIKDKLRARLHLFFQHYSPHLYHEVDNLVKRFWDDQEELFRKLHAKYGPDPPPPKKGMDTKSRLMRFFTKYDPELANDEKIQLVMDSYGGFDEIMWRALTKRYGPELSLEESQGAGGKYREPMDLQSRLQRYFKKHDNQKLAKAMDLAKQYETKEADLRSMLKIVYGAELEQDPDAAEREAREAQERAKAAEQEDAERQEETKKWLVIFLEQHNPKRMSDVDALLQHFKGRQESLKDTVISLFGTGAIDHNTPRLRLIRIYQRYNPNKIEEVDSLLERFHGRTDELFAILREKYGEEPEYEPDEELRSFIMRQENQLPPPMSVRTRKRLQLFFLTYDPRLASSVEHVMTLFRGKEAEMWEQLTSRYGPEPEFRDLEEEERKRLEREAEEEKKRIEAEDQAEALKPMKLSYRERVEAFYRKYAPEKLEEEEFERIMNRHAGKEANLIEQLVRKYGPEPIAPPKGLAAAKEERRQRELEKHRLEQEALKRGSGGASPDGKNNNNSSKAAASLSSSPAVDPKFRNRILRIYQNHMPRKVGDVDMICERFIGREDELIETLKERFGDDVELPASPSLAHNAPVSSGSSSSFSPGGGRSPTTANLSVRERVTRIYQVYNPTKMGEVDKILDRFAGREEALLESLATKYSFTQEPTDAEVKAALAAAVAAQNSSAAGSGGDGSDAGSPTRRRVGFQE